MTPFLIILTSIGAHLMAASGQTLPDSSDLSLQAAARVCSDVQGKLSSASGIFFPNSSEYLVDVTHPAGFFNRANATCVIEPGTNEDTAIIMTSLRENEKAPFGVMGGGHNLNKGFSSTTGVLIALSRFTQLTITPATGPNNQVAEVDLGPGLSWDQVYAQVVPQGVNVAGGRFATVGVSGILLGGGYAWISNEVALGSDNVIAYTVISPKDSSIQEVTNSSNPELFFALKGGLNNFGIVTNFKVKGYPQTNKVWAGTLFTQPGNSDAVAEAFADFAVNNTDPRAQLIGSFAYGNNQSFEVIEVFFNSEESPTVFDKFLSIPLQSQSDFSLRTFDNYTSASLLTIGFLNGRRTLYSTLAVEGFTLPVVKTFQSQRDLLGPQLSEVDPQFFGSWTIEPFLHSYWDTAVRSAVPHTSAHVTFPPNIEFTWSLPQNDDLMSASIANTTNQLLNSALSAGQNVSQQVVYPNYALGTTPVENIYGDNLPELQRIRQQVDPEGVMHRAGGFKIL